MHNGLLASQSQAHEAAMGLGSAYRNDYSKYSFVRWRMLIQSVVELSYVTWLITAPLS